MQTHHFSLRHLFCARRIFLKSFHVITCLHNFNLIFNSVSQLKFSRKFIRIRYEMRIKYERSLSRRTKIYAECDQPFSNANNLKRHFERAHPGQICRPKGQNLPKISVPSKRKHDVNEPVEEWLELYERALNFSNALEF